MRNRKAQGFTLIELLIVIAIIGILAAVLIPNLLSARQAAQDRAAQAYASQVYTTAQALLADDINATAGDVVQADCAGGYSVTAGAPSNRTYAVQDPGSAVSTCAVTTLNNDAMDYLVTVESINGTEYTYGDEGVAP